MKLRKIFKKDIFGLIAIFVVVQVFVYGFVYFLHNTVPFGVLGYKTSYHYFEDAKVEGRPFSFLEGISQYDGQWYLRIANQGYGQGNSSTTTDEYAFFPLYPGLIWVVSRVMGVSVVVGAFILSQILLFCAILSLYYVVRELRGKTVSSRVALLTFLFPISFVFRVYYSDSLYLLILCWFVYFLAKNQFMKSGLALGLLNITRGVGWPLSLVYFVLYFRKSERNLRQMFFVALLVLLPLSVWIYFNYRLTGDGMYFVSSRSAWRSSFPYSLMFNLYLTLNLFALQFHETYSSKVSIVLFWAYFLILMYGWRRLGSVLWLVGVVLLLFPFLVNPVNARFQIINFPIYILLAEWLNDWQYLFLVGVFWVGLLFASVYFVNWRWVG
jgi:hypothetical protein